MHPQFGSSLRILGLILVIVTPQLLARECCIVEDAPNNCPRGATCCGNGTWRCDSEVDDRCKRGGVVCGDESPEHSSSSSDDELDPESSPPRTADVSPPRTGGGPPDTGDSIREDTVDSGPPDTVDSGPPDTGDSLRRDTGRSSTDDSGRSDAGDEPTDGVATRPNTDSDTDGVQGDTSEEFDWTCGCGEEHFCLSGDIFECEYATCCGQDEECVVRDDPEEGGNCKKIGQDDTADDSDSDDSGSDLAQLCDIELTGFPTLNGIYELQSGLEAGHRYYSSSEVYLYFREAEQIWFFGPELGEETVFAKSRGDSSFPQSVLHWTVWNGNQFIRDPSFAIQCAA